MRRQQVLSRQLPDGWLLAATDGSGDPVHLEGSASAVWDLLAKPRTIHDLTGTLIEEFTIPEAEATAAIRSCVAALSRHGLIETASATDTGFVAPVP